MLRFWIMMTCLSLFLTSATIQAQPMDGSCALHKFSLVMVDKDGTLDTNQCVWVLRHNAPVYPTVDSIDSSSIQGFGDYLLPVKVAKRPDTGVQRVQVRKIGTYTPIGWMEGHDLLCGVDPLQSDKGLDRKVFIKTPASHDPNLSTVPAYLSYDYEGPCNEDCEQFSRFDLYFIFAEDKLHRRYLILKRYTLKDKDESFSSLKLAAGWVKYDHTIPWDTTLGLRPKEEVDTLLAYEQPENINNPNGKQRVAVAGGKIWYTYPIHIPILDINKEQNYYHAAASGIGFGSYENVLSSLKSVDVFFLLDGTASMVPHIKAVGQAAQQLAENFKATSFRFGFRVYRDIYADRIMEEKCEGVVCRKIPLCIAGVCEGMPLSTETCSFDQEAGKANWAEFKDKIGKVKETCNENDDYLELFDGLRRALYDIASCPERTKLLFVIGNHGDEQQWWPQDIITRLKGLAERVIVFFIQTPNNSSQARNPGAYQHAYNAYKDQAYKLLEEILPPEFQGEEISSDKYFLLFDQTQLTEKIVEGVKPYSPSDLINEIEQALAGGKSLQQILDQHKAEGDMPVIYRKWLKDTACPKLKEQCETSVEHGVLDFYIPIDATKVQEEVWMTTENLNNWLNLLKSFERIKTRPVRSQKEIFIRWLRGQIQKLIGAYPPGNLVLSEWLAEQRKQALPIRQDSPLLQYSFEEIRHLLGCEMSLLVNRVAEIRQVLQRVYSDSTKKVAFTPKYPTSISCPLSDKGKKVPESLEFQPSEPLGPDETYRYDHTLYGKTVYWLPVEFLP